jgi:hypothetical protein
MSQEPSTGTQAFTFSRASNIFWRSTWRSRTTGNFVSGSSRIGCSSSSISAAQACRGTPLTSMLHAPHTSSMQLDSQTTGLTRRPSTVSGCWRRYMSAETTLWPGA